MTHEELTLVLSEGEGYRIEFKEQMGTGICRMQYR